MLSTLRERLSFLRLRAKVAPALRAMLRYFDERGIETMGLGVRESGAIIGISVVTASVDPPNAVAVTNVSVAVTVPGVAVGDTVLCIPPDTFTNGLAPVAGNVTAPNVVTVRVANGSAGAIDGAALVWTFIIFDRTPLS